MDGEVSEYDGEAKKRFILARLEEQGECKGLDPNVFFPSGSKDDVKLAEGSAQKVCRRCPVQRECLQYAIDFGENHGVWGGHGERSRRRVAKKIAAGVITIEEAL